MPLSARELVLIMRARDEASRAINQVAGSVGALGNSGLLASQKLTAVGTALLTVGTALGGAGALGVGFLSQAEQLAEEYDKLASLTLTQAGRTTAGLEELKRIGLEVSTTIPASLSGVQQGLFDIFSSVDANVPQATNLIELLAKAAVAGDTEVSSASQSVLGALNAWQLPLSDANKLLDTQFRLVELGIGTYEQFSGSMGRAVPASVAAGQSFGDLSGALAFLTRNNLSAEQSATSVMRALELIADPKAVRNLKEIGVEVVGADGNFRSLTNIVTDLAEGPWKDLTKPERKEAFKEIFGTGTVQARRFFDVAIPNYKDLNRITGLVVDSGGSLERAYEIMFNAPANQSQLLQNRFEALRIEVGDKLIPAKLRLMEVANDLLDAWNNLSPETQELIIKFVAFASAAALVLGILVALVGGFLLFVGIIAPVVGGVGALAAIFAILVASVIQAIAYGLLLVTNWEEVKNKLIEIWTQLLEAKDWVVNIAQEIWEKWLELWPQIQQLAIDAKDAIVEAAQQIWAKLLEFYAWASETFGPGLQEIWNVLKEEFPKVAEEVGETVIALQEHLQSLWDKWVEIWDSLAPKVQDALELAKAAATRFIEDMKAFWQEWGDEIILITTVTWNQIVNMVTTTIQVISNIIQLALNIWQGDWEEAHLNMQNITSIMWDFVRNTFSNGTALVLGLGRSFLVAIVNIWIEIRVSTTQLWIEIMAAMFNAVVSGVNQVLGFLRGLPGQIIGIFAGAGGWLIQAGRDIIGGLISGIRARIPSLRGILGSITGLIPNLKGPAAVDKRLLYQNGRWIMEGLQRGLRDEWANVHAYIASITQASSFDPALNVGVSGGSGRDPQLAQAISELVFLLREQSQGERNGLKVEGDLILGGDRTEDDLDELDIWASARGAGV